MLRAADYTKAFFKDGQWLTASERYDIVRLEEAMLLLSANDAPLGFKRLIHALKGNWVEHMECHNDGDFLPIYQVKGRLQARQKNLSTSLQSTLLPHRYARHGERIREGREGQRTRAGMGNRKAKT